MTIPATIILTAYLIGYFISMGIVMGIHEKFDRDAIWSGIFIGLFSWIVIGMHLADFLPSKEKNKIINKT